MAPETPHWQPKEYKLLPPEIVESAREFDSIYHANPFAPDQEPFSDLVLRTLDDVKNPYFQGHRVLSFTGKSGVGKSRAVTEVARLSRKANVPYRVIRQESFEMMAKYTIRMKQVYPENKYLQRRFSGFIDTFNSISRDLSPEEVKELHDYQNQVGPDSQAFLKIVGSVIYEEILQKINGQKTPTLTILEYLSGYDLGDWDMRYLNMASLLKSGIAKDKTKTPPAINLTAIALVAGPGAYAGLAGRFASQEDGTARGTSSPMRSATRDTFLYLKSLAWNFIMTYKDVWDINKDLQEYMRYLEYLSPYALNIVLQTDPRLRGYINRMVQVYKKHPQLFQSEIDPFRDVVFEMVHGSTQLLRAIEKADYKGTFITDPPIK
jgi:hypothetical protein